MAQALCNGSVRQVRRRAGMFVGQRNERIGEGEPAGGRGGRTARRMRDATFRVPLIWSQV